MPLSPTQKARADIAEAYGYLPTYVSILQETCASFWWHGNDEHGNNRILQNGTVCFVNTGTTLIAVTAAHVLDEYITAKHHNPSIVCQLGSIRYDPENHVIEMHRDLDIATFSVSTVVIAGSNSSPTTPSGWPPSSVLAGDVLLCGGHPGAIRREDNDLAHMPFQWFLATAASSNENISLTLELDTCHVPLSDNSLANQALGGMSGGPVFKYIPPSPIERIELVGLIYEFNPAYGLMFARPASYIDRYGNVNPQGAA